MYWGRILGAFCGYLIAGPVGVLLGLFAGNTFDKGFVSYYHGQAKQHQKIQSIFFKTTFLVMGHIAKSGGRVSEDAIRTARAVMRRMRLDKQHTQLAMRYFTEGKQRDFSLEQAISELIQTCSRQRALLQMFIEIQYQAAQAGGVIPQTKQHILEILCQRLGCKPAFYRFTEDFTNASNNQKQQHSFFRDGSLQEAYSRLELSTSASFTEVKRKYRRLMSQNHPDKLIAQGLPEEMIKIATDKTQKIQAAYDRIREHAQRASHA